MTELEKVNNEKNENDDLELSNTMNKIIDAMSKVHIDLIAFKKSKNSPLVVMQDGKIVKLSPWDFSIIDDEQ
jgi:hypothetical protein